MRKHSGTTLVEYALIMLLIVIVIILMLRTPGLFVSSSISSVVPALEVR